MRLWSETSEFTSTFAGVLDSSIIPSGGTESELEHATRVGMLIETTTTKLAALIVPFTFTPDG